MKKKVKKEKPINWAKVLKESQRMEKTERLQRFYWLVRDLKYLMEEMSPGLKGKKTK